VSRENVELLRRLWPARVDMVQLVEAGLPLLPEGTELLDPDAPVEFLSSAPGVQSARYRGLEGFADGWRDWLTPFDRYELSIQEVVDAGDDVVVLTHVRARTHRDGVQVEHDPAAVFSLRAGRVVGVRFYLDRAAALEAAGVSAAG
jgi:ketosteroid isomerase-like protein